MAEEDRIDQELYRLAEHAYDRVERLIEDIGQVLLERTHLFAGGSFHDQLVGQVKVLIVN